MEQEPRLKRKIQQHIPDAEKKSAGRNRVEINLIELKKLMQYKPTISMTASHFEISKKSVERIIDREFNMTFAEFRDYHMAGRKFSLIQRALQRAEKSDYMLIYCLNNLCGWSHNPDKDDEDDRVDDIIFQDK